jgi:hypothetical protein
MTKKFEELRRSVRSNPARRARVEQFKRAMDDAVHLAELRESRAVSQQELAGRMSLTQGRVSTIERSNDWYLSTLSGYVAALGGELKVTAVFDNDSIELPIPSGEESQ